LSKIRSRLSYANVASTLALFLAVSGGTALAASKIGTNQIQRNAVTSSRIAPNAVTSSRLANNAVTGPKIRAGSITSSDVQNGSLQANDFAPGQLPAGPQGPPGPAGSSIAGVVSSFGTLIYGRGVTAVSVAGTGVYTVSFNQNVSQCPAVATIGGYQLGGATENGTNGGAVSLQPNGNANPTASSQITFVTRGLNGVNTPLPFHFAVFCLELAEQGEPWSCLPRTLGATCAPST
jgi:hypothetical protein